MTNIFLGISLAAILVTLIVVEIINRKVDTIMANLNKLQTEVSELTTVVASAKALIDGLSQQIKDAGTDQAALDALTDQMDSQANSLAAAVAANTPAPPV